MLPVTIIKTIKKIIKKCEGLLTYSHTCIMTLFIYDGLKHTQTYTTMEKRILSDEGFQTCLNLSSNNDKPLLGT